MPQTPAPTHPTAPEYRSWVEIADDPAYRQLDDAGQFQTQVEYFRQAILPTVKRGDEEEAWSTFLDHTQEVDSLTQRSLRAAKRFFGGDHNPEPGTPGLSGGQ